VDALQNVKTVADRIATALGAGARA
jgi:hypothetical protein